MDPAIIFALASLLCAGVNDFIFKRYVSKSHTYGTYLTLTGLVWTLIFLAAAIAGGGPKFDRYTLLYGFICGFFSITAQIFFLAALRGVNTSIGATIYRLNFVVVVMLAPIFLQETLTPLHAAGIFLAVCAVCLLSQNNGAPARDNGRQRRLVTLAIIASILRGLMGLFYKIAALHNVDARTFLLFNPLCWIAGGLIYAFFWEHSLSQKHSIRLLLYGGTSGVLVAGITLFLLLAVRSGKAVVVIPITQMSFIVTGFLSILLLKERLSPAGKVGILCAIGTILCLSR